MDLKHEFDAVSLSSDSTMKAQPTSCVECQQPPPKRSQLLIISLILNWVQLIILGIVALLVMRMEIVPKDSSHAANSTQLSSRQNGLVLPISCLTGVTEDMVQQFTASSGAMLHPGISCPDVDLNGFYTPTDYYEIAVDPGKMRRDSSLPDSGDGNFGADHSTEQTGEGIKARSDSASSHTSTRRQEGQGLSTGANVGICIGTILFTMTLGYLILICWNDCVH